MDQISVLSSAVVQCPNEVERQSLTCISCLLGPWKLEWEGKRHGNQIFQKAGGKWPQALEIILLQRGNTMYTYVSQVDRKFSLRWQRVGLALVSGCWKMALALLGVAPSGSLNQFSQETCYKFLQRENLGSSSGAFDKFVGARNTSFILSTSRKTEAVRLLEINS